MQKCDSIPGHVAEVVFMVVYLYVRNKLGNQRRDTESGEVNIKR